VLYSSDAYPGRIYNMTLDGKILGVLGTAGKMPKQFGWIPRDLPVGEHPVRRRTAELAGSEIDSASVAIDPDHPILPRF
jgi:hypothetical protein